MSKSGEMGLVSQKAQAKQTEKGYDQRGGREKEEKGEGNRGSCLGVI